MALLVGALIALAVGALGRGAGFDRDRSYYPVVTIVVAHYYPLYAVLGGSYQVLLLESLVGLVFLAAAVAGFRASLWIAAAALTAHGVFDLVHGLLIANPGVPAWWPAFCLGFDVVAGVVVGYLLTSGKIHPRPDRPTDRLTD